MMFCGFSHDTSSLPAHMAYTMHLHWGGFRVNGECVLALRVLKAAICLILFDC